MQLLSVEASLCQYLNSLNSSINMMVNLHRAAEERDELPSSCDKDRK